MISVVVHGRNDGHGYNMHRRVALSLNCMAEILTDPDDELIFVDYNTPGELPTLLEALSDTLTERCLARTRVLRVPETLHAERFASRTHLPIVEPVARNCAVRRSNQANRWILSTTTDMIFTPLGERSLSDICAALPDGFYALPRFELPEWLWESLPRSKPQDALSALSRLGPALALDEPTINHDWIRFDAPGDFQLILREDIFAIDGFDERMLLGWHVDSNLSRRLHDYRGSTQTLEGDLAGYHCNHNRTVTIYHDTTVANDLDRFVFRLQRTQIPEQRTTWGLVGEELEEIELTNEQGLAFAAAVESAIERHAASRVISDARTDSSLEYDSAHVLPFVADEIRVSSRATTVGYLGANPVLERMLAALVGNCDMSAALLVADPSNEASVDELERRADLCVVDLGVDVSLVSGSLSVEGPGHGALRTGLRHAFEGLGRLVERERARLEDGAQPRRFVLVNSHAVYWNAFVLKELHCSATTPHSRVRRARVKRDPGYLEEPQAAMARGGQLLRWISRWDAPRQHVRLRPSESVFVAELDDFSGFKRGWGLPDPHGVWTDGPRAELSVALESAAREVTLVLGVDDVRAPDSEPLVVDVLAGDQILDTREFGRTARAPDYERTAAASTTQKPLHRRLGRAIGLNRIPAVRQVYTRAVMARARLASSGRRSSEETPRSRFMWPVPLVTEASRDTVVDVTLRLRGPAHAHDDRPLGVYLKFVRLEELHGR